MSLVERLREFVRRCAPGVDTVGKPETGVICAEAADEITRLNAALQWEQNRSERIGTHWDGCHLAGHQHYECLLRENARLTAELADYRKALEVRNKQLGVACMKHDLVHSLACGICLTETRDLAEHNMEVAYLAGQASAEQQITELKYLLSRVLEASVPYYDDGTPIINDELSDRLNKVLP